MRTEAQSKVNEVMRYNSDEYQRGDQQQISVRDEGVTVDPLPTFQSYVVQS